jgi:hypothetical protein
MKNIEQKLLEVMCKLYVLDEENMVKTSDIKYIADYLQKLEIELIKEKNPKQIDLIDMINEVESENKPINNK